MTAEFDVETMRLALEHANASGEKGNTPVASVIAQGTTILGVGENEVRSSGDCTAHAEIVALRRALAEHGAEAVAGGTCYTTMEPCPMCLWALVEGGITRIVLGARHRQIGRKAYGAYDLESLLDLTGRRIEITTGVLADACGDMRLDWMRRMGRES